MAAGRPVEQAITLTGIVFAGFVVVGHMLSKPCVFLGRVVNPFGNIPAPGTPDILTVGAAFQGKGHDAVRSNHTARQLIADFDFFKVRRIAFAVGHDPIQSLPVNFVQFSLRPLFRCALFLVVHAAFFSFFAQVANGGGTFFCDQGAVLIAVHGIAAGKDSRASEFGFRDAVAIKATVLKQLVTRTNGGAVEPPLLAAENQVGAGDFTDAGGVTAVAVVHGYRERLGRDNTAPL